MGWRIGALLHSLGTPGTSREEIVLADTLKPLPQLPTVLQTEVAVPFQQLLWLRGYSGAANTVRALVEPFSSSIQSSLEEGTEGTRTLISSGQARDPASVETRFSRTGGSADPLAHGGPGPERGCQPAVRISASAIDLPNNIRMPW